MSRKAESMEEEKFFNGYCRQADQTRMVCVCREDGEITECDCLYETCIYAKQCTVGKDITKWLQES